MIVAGVDVGSVTTKAVILDDSSQILSYSIIPTGASSKRAASNSMEQALILVGIEVNQVDYIISTGYGRESVTFRNEKITEITCHAAGGHYLFPKVRTLIDIGGQDSKVIAVRDNGEIKDFAMNDKCAAGTGRFLEVMARALEVDLKDMGKLSLQSKNEVHVSNMCTVFAESEVVSLIAANYDKEDIIAGIHQAIASRVANMVFQVGLEKEVMMVGGVAKNIGVVRALEHVLGSNIFVPQECQITGALGAALLALQHASAVDSISKDNCLNERRLNS